MLLENIFLLNVHLSGMMVSLESHGLSSGKKEFNQVHGFPLFLGIFYLIDVLCFVENI